MVAGNRVGEEEEGGVHSHARAHRNDPKMIQCERREWRVILSLKRVCTSLGIECQDCDYGQPQGLHINPLKGPTVTLFT